MTAERFVDDRLDGMIIACSVSSTIYDLLHQAKKPFVEFSTGSSPYVIEADNFGGAVQAVEYLLELGHRRIICFNTNLYSELGKKERPFWERTEGFRSVMERFPPWQEKENLVITEGDQLCYLLQHPPSERPTAIFATLEQDAFDAMDYIRECGLQIPKDISLIAFDNGPISVLARPKLTTIHTPYDAMAKESIRLLSKLVDEEEALPPPPLKTHLVVRASTSAPTPY
jgi:LacI family transcriptional regulator